MKETFFLFVPLTIKTIQTLFYVIHCLDIFTFIDFKKKINQHSYKARNQPKFFIVLHNGKNFEFIICLHLNMNLFE